ncbi:MAG: Na+/H+ antiporter subunit E [Pseudomonadales bacterium]|nr:Na+/H+ antiporter subunit E [Pseudomonadales bacterium]
MKNFIWLAFLLAVFWIINSGHFDGLLLSLGLISVLFVVWLNHRMSRIGEEYQPPVILSLRLPFYVLWLVKEIVKSNIEVIRAIWQRKPAIEPSVITVKASQQSDLHKALYANSITMTPGTVTMEIEGDQFTIHALTRASREGVESGDMDRRVRSLED